MAETPTFTLEPGAFAVQRNQEGRYDVGQLGEDGTWSWRGTAVNPEYAARIVSEALDGTAEARSKRFWAGIQQLITEVRPEVQEIMGTLGFEPEHTGGGCMLWAKPIEDGTVLWLSYDAGLDGPPGDPQWIIGRYTTAGEAEGSVEVCNLTLADASEIGQLIPSPLEDPGEPVQRIFESKAEYLAWLGTRK